MANAVLLVMSNATDGADENEFNRWYDEVHGPEMIDRGAAVSFRRYRLSDVPLRPGMPTLDHSYVCIYEVEAATEQDVQRIVDQLRATKELTKGISETMDISSVVAAFFLPVGTTTDQ